MSYNLGNINSLFEKIDDVLTYYEGSKFYERRQRLYLASGTFLNYSVPKKVVAHLLGINTNYLISTDLFRSTFSYELIEELLAKGAMWLDTQIKAGIINPDYLFSEFINEKLDCFNDNIRIDFKKIEFVNICNRNKIINNGKDVEQYDYIIVRKLDNKYLFLGLTVNEDYKVYPRTSQLYDSIEDLIAKNKFRFDEQQITYITSGNSQNNFEGYNKSYVLSANDKIAQISKLKKYDKIFKGGINVIQDYSFCLSKYSEFLDVVNDNRGASNEELMTKLKSLQSDIVAYKEIIERLNNQIIEQNATIDNLKNANKEKEEIITSIRKLVK